VVLPAHATTARAMARNHGATIVDDPKKGISHAINLGVRARRDEEFYAWMGDDDLFRPGGLLLLRALLQSNPGAVVSYGACDYISPQGVVLRTNRAGLLARAMLAWGPNLIPHPGSMIRIDALERVGLFDESLKYAMDLDVFLKLRALGSFVATRTPVSAFRWHAESLTVSARTASGDEAESIKRRHLPRFLRPISPLWTVPIKWAAARAAASLNATERKIESTSR
jgi:GT2 family glycosyltransferase